MKFFQSFDINFVLSEDLISVIRTSATFFNRLWRLTINRFILSFSLLNYLCIYKQATSVDKITTVINRQTPTLKRGIVFNKGNPVVDLYNYVNSSMDNMQGNPKSTVNFIELLWHDNSIITLLLFRRTPAYSLSASWFSP